MAPERRSSGRAPAAARQRFRDNRFGMFIHFGLYSLLGRHEWVMYTERMPATEIRGLARRFRPRRLDPSVWVAVARRAGMRYACLTTRHHEGFALFDSKASEFTAPNSAAGRDLVREFVDACRAGGLRPCLYYSVGNWSDPGYLAGPKRDPQGWKRFVGIAHTQLRELMTNYGEIDYLFYDGCPPPDTWDCLAINQELRRLQPNLLISDRCQLDEDVASAEQHTIGDPGKLWESCMTTNQSWGWNRADPYYRSPRELLQHLLTCVHNGGNYLLNVGPTGDGTLPRPAIRRLEIVGDWLQRHGDAVYATEPHPDSYALQHLTTGRGNLLYVPLHFYRGPATVLAGLANRVETVSILGTGQRVSFSQVGSHLHVTGLPWKAPDPRFTVLELTLDGIPRGIPNPRSPAGNYD